ncbi:MAG TPA: hypothetical protein VK421_14270, partial [Pyrinomonadaceae bacterium]|nr:hypothetical protein [Pyrinomonadaceae bacterium]
LAYRDQIGRLAELLREAAHHTAHPHFSRYLLRRAKDLLNDDYFISDSLWAGLSDNPLDIVVGPCEVYEDQLMGLKAAFEAMLLRRDFEGTERIRHFQDKLPALCRAVEAEIGKSLVIDNSQLDLSMADLVYTGGDARKAIPAIAFTLPNDERVIEQVGSRQVILKNVLEAKFHYVAWAIQERLASAAPGERRASYENFLNHTLFHEISHTIGPQLITKDGVETTVNRSLKQYYSVLEEAKADTLAVCIMLCGADAEARAGFLRGYVPGILRPIRYGLSTAHGGANAIQFNYLLERGAVGVGPAGELRFDAERVRRSLTDLTARIIDIQERGDFNGAQQLVAAYRVLSPEVEHFTRGLARVPVDIRISYAV